MPLSRLALAIALLLIGSPYARADCAPPDPFAEADAAARVDVVDVAKIGPAFTATVNVVQRIKGDGAPRPYAHPYNPMSGPSFTRGERYVLFLDANGKSRSDCTTLAVAAKSPLVAALRSWVTTRAPRERAALLVRASVEHSADPLSTQALVHLGHSPALLVEIDAAAQQKLTQAIPSSLGERAHALAWVLARLHAIESVPIWIEYFHARHAMHNLRPIQDALELLTNRHDPAYTVGHDFDAAQVERLRLGWQTWWTAHGRLSRDALLVAGFTTRQQALPPGTTWPDRRAVRHLLRDGIDDLSRRVALDFCEQQQKLEVSRLSPYAQYIEWAQAIAACPAP